MIVSALFATWLESRSNATSEANAAGQTAQKRATAAAVTTSDERADRAWKIIKFVLERNEQSIAECHERVNELEEATDGILSALDERTRTGRRERLNELREAPRSRSSKRRPPPAASRLPDDYSTVQAIDPGDLNELE